MSNIIWKQPNGTLAVTSILDGSHPLEHAGLLQRRGDIPADWSLELTACDTFPTWPRQEDWVIEDGVIVTSLTRAKASTADRLRYERIAPLAKQDISFQRATELGTDHTAIVAEKNRLRDLPTLVESCESLAELSALTV